MTQVSVAYQGPTWTSALLTRERRLYSCYGQIYIYIPAAPAAPPSQKASSDDISGTKRGTIDPLVSKRPEKILNKKINN